MLRRQFLPAVVMVVIMTVITGLVYTFAFTGFAQVVAPERANGSRVHREQRVVIKLPCISTMRLVPVSA